MLYEAFCGQQIRSYTHKNWQPLIDLIPPIENTVVFGEWIGEKKHDDGSISLPLWCKNAPIVDQFMEVVYSIPIIICFNWSKWDKGRKISKVTFDFDTVDLVTKCKLISAIVRNDRFCEGALVSAFNSGLMLKILKSIEKEIA
jgi:hypothetical protein